MNKNYEYTINEEKKIIFLPPPIGGPPSWMAYARDYYFKMHFGKRFKRVIYSRDSWENHIKLNEVKILEVK